MTAMEVACDILFGEDRYRVLSNKQIRRINKRMRKMMSGEFIIRHANRQWWLETV